MEVLTTDVSITEVPTLYLNPGTRPVCGAFRRMTGPGGSDPRP